MKRAVLVIMVITFFGLLPLISSCAKTHYVDFSRDPEKVLDKMVDEFRNLLNVISNDMDKASRQIARADLKSEGARRALAELCEKYKSIAIDCSAIDASGKMVTVEPAKYRHLEGTDMSSRSLISMARQSKRPSVGDVARSVEGVSAVALDWPIFSDDAKEDYLGAVDFLFQPDSMVRDLIEKQQSWNQYEVWVLQKNGKFLYNPDPNENGKNIFTNPYNASLTEFVALGKRITEERSGSGTYRYQATGQAFDAKRCIWKTLDVYNGQVRIVIVQKVH